MSRVVRIPVEDAIPSSRSVCKTLSIPGDSGNNPRLQSLTRQAMEIYHRRASPVGILADISRNDFETIFEGEGMNEPDSPLGMIYLSMYSRALFAVTLGQAITEEISVLFNKREFALATILDALASEGCELAASRVEQEFVRSRREAFETVPSPAVARFSPGYCGWHISSQRKLFRYLRPQLIGIELLDSCLMNPLKSISGVIVVGSREILESEMSQPVCTACKTESCSDRIKSVSELQSQKL